MINKFVKVRSRQGTKSLDITIPVEISEKYHIKAGDLFKINVIDENAIILKYELIYKNK